MNAIASALKLIFSPLLWLRLLFGFQVRIKRRGTRFRLVLEDGHRAPIATSPGSTCAPAGMPSLGPVKVADKRASDMQSDMRQLISHHPQTRRLMPQLAYIERVLRRSGPDAIDELPLDVLKKGLAQLTGLVSDWSSPGFAEMRLRLATKVTDKENAALHFQPSNSVMSDFLTPQRIHVSEATASDFRAAEHAWSGPTDAKAEESIRPGSN